MRKFEQEFSTKLSKWLKHNAKWNGPIEVKVSYDKLFNYKSGFKDHQIPNLLSSIFGTLVYKISDASAMMGFGQLPFDMIVYNKAFPLVAIMWHKPRNKTFYLIHPLSIRNEMEKGSKSLSEERAKQICYLKAELK